MMRLADTTKIKREYVKPFRKFAMSAALTCAAIAALYPLRVSAQQKLVPLRIVQALDDCPGGACEPLMTNEQIRMIVDRTNEIFAPSNVKFWVISDERYEIPSLDDYNLDEGAPEVSWAAAKSDAQKVFPDMPLNAYADSYSADEAQLIASIVACYGDRNEITVWVVDKGSSSGGFPERSHVFALRKSNALKEHSFAGEFATSHVGHELGHHFGLRHTFQAKGAIISDAEIINPLTGVQFQMRDFWEQLYCDGSTAGVAAWPYFFTSASDFDNFGCQNVRKIIGGASDGGNTGSAASIPYRPFVDLDTVFGTTYTYLAGATWVSGIIRDFGGDHIPEWGVYQYGINVMDFFSNYGFSGDLLLAPAFMTDDQGALVWGYATTPVFLGSESLNNIKDDGSFPSGCRTDVASANRHLLGETEEDLLWWSNGDFTFANETKPVVTTAFEPISGDFDADGVDDIVWYNPDDGWAHYWWGDGAGRTFTHQDWNALGEDFVAFAGDFDGANGDDIFLYKVGTNPDSIMFSNGNRTFTTVQVNVDLTYSPVVANLDGIHGDDIVWYQPSTGIVNMWWSNGDQTFTEASPLDTGLLNYSPFSGNFDGDNAGDVFWYRAGSGPSDVDMMTWGLYASRVLTFGTTEEVSGTYDPVVGNYDNDPSGSDDIFWESPGHSTDFIWEGRVDRTFDTSRRSSMFGVFKPVVGDFDGDGAHDIFWYREPPPPPPPSCSVAGLGGGATWLFVLLLFCLNEFRRSSWSGN